MYLGRTKYTVKKKTFAILPACRPPMMVALAFSSMFISNGI
jgi:ABC-type Fe3+ transport system permease subunit